MTRREIIAMLGSAGAIGVMPSGVWAQPSAADLAGDIDILRAALALHPGLHRYNSPDTIDAAIAALAPRFAAAPDLAARYLLLSRFLATIRCGHSYCNFFNQSDAVRSDLFGRPTRLPFAFRWFGDTMVVTADHSASGQFAPGTIVTHVNGVASADLLAALMPYARADGGNDGKRRALLGVGGDDSIEFFDVFHGLLAPPPNGMHHLRIIAPGAPARMVAVAPLDLAQRRAFMPPAPADDAVAWSWDMRPDGVALLTMPGWALYRSSWNWRQWLDDRLDSLAGAKGLVIDLRQNEGGLDCGDAILARLTDHRLDFSDGEQRLRFRRTPPALDRYLDTWDDRFRTLGEGAEALPGGFYRRPAFDGRTAIEPQGRRVTLPVAALVGPTNSSATFGFAERAKATGLVHLFGQETGGNRRGINGGCFFFVRLPASGIEFDLPLVGYFPAIPQPDAGITPHVTVNERAVDLAIGRDRVLEAALSWIAAA